MEDIKKQRICKKFNSDLEKPTSEIYEMLQKTFLMILCVGEKPSNGSHISKFAKPSVEDLERSGHQLLSCRS
jgi:hypothetical protein